MSNGLDPDRKPCFVGPDQGPNCLQQQVTALGPNCLQGQKSQLAWNESSLDLGTDPSVSLSFYFIFV